MITDLKTFCHLFYCAFAIPVNYYQISSGNSCSFPAIMDDQTIFKNSPSHFFHLHKNPDYFVSESFGYFGSIQVPSKESVITIGPIFSTPVSDSALHNFMLEWAINSDHKEKLSQIFSTIPLLSINQFLQILAYLHLCLNDEQIDIGSHFGLMNTNVVSSFSNIHSNEVIRAKETQHFHNTYFFECQLTRCIQNGDIASLNRLLKESAELSGGVLADNSLRQEKNIFITTTALVTRSAISGGMDMEQAYMLADLYIQECERS